MLCRNVEEEKWICDERLREARGRYLGFRNVPEVPVQVPHGAFKAKKREEKREEGNCFAIIILAIFSPSLRLITAAALRRIFQSFDHYHHLNPPLDL